MGSIPPAASIEHPQREVVNFIKDSTLTPDAADLHQLARAVQSGYITYAVDQGTASQMAITLTPPPLALKSGFMVKVKPAYTATGPSTLNVNGLGPKPIKKSSNKDIQAADYFAGDLLVLVYDGAQFFMIGSQPVTLLAGAMDYYVATTGSDSNNGLTPSTPFLTIEHAIAVT